MVYQRNCPKLNYFNDFERFNNMEIENSRVLSEFKRNKRSFWTIRRFCTLEKCILKKNWAEMNFMFLGKYKYFKFRQRTIINISIWAVHLLSNRPLNEFFCGYQLIVLVQWCRLLKHVCNPHAIKFPKSRVNRAGNNMGVVSWIRF